MRSALAVAVVWGALLAPLHADESLPKAFTKSAPESIKDLKEIQDHVQKLAKKVMPAVVGVRIGGSSGSGIIVNKEGMVLTAGHVSGAPNRDCQLIMPDGKKLKGKTLGANKGIDSGMIQITDAGDYPFIEMGTSADLKKGDWCMAIGHPGGYVNGRTPVVRLGRILESQKSLIRSDCTLVGGDSGGPLFDMQGKVIGIHSRIGGAITANIHVPVDTYRETWDKLAKAEVFGDNLFGKIKTNDAYLGIRGDADANNGLKVQFVAPDSPAEKAGLKVNDLIVMIDNQKVGTSDDLGKVLTARRPGVEVAIQVRRGEETLMLKVTLAKRPT
jgi:serine protease Do